MNVQPLKSLCLTSMLAACLVWSAHAAADMSDPAQIQTEAFIQLLQADQALDAGRLEEALGLYTSARDGYVRVATEFPSYDPRVIQYRRSYCAIAGMIAGTYTDPPALAYANSICSKEAPALGYSTVYPLSMFLRIFTAQIIVLFFCG